MLYKRNGERRLDEKLFKNPTKEYRGTPFWSWNCKMTPEILTEQIEYLKQMGFGGFHMHSRDGMDNEYLSDEFMNLIKACVDKAEKEDMLAWLYDEDRWPSGAAGGLVTKTPKYRQRHLVFAPADMLKTRDFTPEKILWDFSEEAETDEAVEKGLPYFAGAYDVTVDENGYLKEYRRIDRNAKAKGVKWAAYCETGLCDGWYNNQTYVDTLSGEAIKKFIEITHERYKEVVGDRFDKSVPAIFTDEPQFANKQVLDTPFALQARWVPWTADLSETYKKAYGIDVLDKLPELFWDLPDGNVSFARYAYHDHTCQRFTEAFSENIGKWCDRNNIKLTGHMMEEPNLYSQTHMIGEAMRAYKYFGYPGIDMLCNSIELATAKQAQSAVRQYGREAMTSELYGVTNWDFDFRGHKFQGDWQAALGVTIRVPHLSWVSMKGSAKRDYPASINYQSPWYKEYTFIEDHFARLNTALTRGKADVKVCAIHPIESYWLHYGPNLTSHGVRTQMDERFDSFNKWMLYGQIDFDYVSESLLPELSPSPSAPLTVGEMTYDVVIVPELETMRPSTLAVLKKFQAAGGKLIFMGECPKYVNAAPSDAVRPVYQKSTVIPFDKVALMNALLSYRDVELVATDGKRTDNYIYQMRTDNDCKWLFLAQSKHYSQADCVSPKAYTLTIKGEYEPILYDTLSGDIKKISFKKTNGKTVIPLSLNLSDSVLLKLIKSDVTEYSAPEKEFTVLKELDFKHKVNYTRAEPNVLVLDEAEYTYDGKKEFAPLEEVLRADNIVRKAINLPQRSSCQPWAKPPVKATHTISLRFTFNSEITISGAMLALEDAADSQITLDGKPVSNKTVGYFTDKSIETVALPVITEGKHALIITKPISERTYTEWSYILGEFNVRLEGVEKTLTAPTSQIGFGSVVSQGLPFYGGNLTYELPFTADENCSVIVHASHYRGALIGVELDGKPAGKIVFAPYDALIENVKKGNHTIKLTLFGNRNNSFSALHCADPSRYWFGPDAWTTTGEAWSYEYTLKPFGILTSPTLKLVK